MKTNFFVRTRSVLSVPSILVAISVICSAAIANAQEPTVSGSATAGSTASPAAAASAAQKTDTEWDGITAELTSVAKGDGDTVTIKFKYTNGGSTEVNISKIGQFSHDNVVEHVYYIDPKNKKKYLVIKDTAGAPVASNMRYLELKPGESKAGWAKLPAPPPDVNAITVYIPGAPPFESVSINR
ncbi:MAG: hypothetical protein JWO45_1916 [Spartobacteria bacterium]|nr:hypothetical protein [Spartobacteria bacterium]